MCFYSISTFAHGLLILVKYTFDSSYPVLVLVEMLINTFNRVHKEIYHSCYVSRDNYLQ